MMQDFYRDVLGSEHLLRNVLWVAGEAVAALILCVLSSRLARRLLRVTLALPALARYRRRDELLVRRLRPWSSSALCWCCWA